MYIEADNDAFADLVVANGFQTHSGMFIYRNKGNGNHWLNVRLVGTVSNRSAIGAKVRLLATLTNGTGTLEFHDPENSNDDCQYYRVVSR